MYKKERRIMSLSQIPFTKVRRTDIALHNTSVSFVLFFFFIFFSVSFFSLKLFQGFRPPRKQQVPTAILSDAALPCLPLWVNVGKVCKSKGFLARLIDEQQLSEFPARPDSSSSGWLFDLWVQPASSPVAHPCTILLLLKVSSSFPYYQTQHLCKHVAVSQT